MCENFTTKKLTVSTSKNVAHKKWRKSEILSTFFALPSSAATTLCFNKAGTDVMALCVCSTSYLANWRLWKAVAVKGKYSELFMCRPTTRGSQSMYERAQNARFRKAEKE